MYMLEIKLLLHNQYQLVTVPGQVIDWTRGELLTCAEKPIVVFISVGLFVCLLETLRKNGWIEFHED